MAQDYLQILISFLISPEKNKWFFIVKTIFITFSLIGMGFIFFALSKSSWLKLHFLYDFFEFLNYRPFGVKKIEKSWKKIMLKLETGLESEYKLALIEADNMLNEMLKKMGYGGETLGERLDNLTTATLPNLEEIKKAHKIRNNIIHDPNYKLSLDETKKNLIIFEKAFTDIGAF